MFVHQITWYPVIFYILLVNRLCTQIQSDRGVKRSTLHAPDTFTQIKRGGSFILFPFFFEQFYFTPIFLDFTCKRARGDFVQGGAGVESKLSHIHTPIYFSKIITEGNKNNIRRSSKESKEIQHRQVTDTIWFEICFYPPSLVFLSIAALDWSFSIPSISHHLHLYLDLFYFHLTCNTCCTASKN